MKNIKNTTILEKNLEKSSLSKTSSLTVLKSLQIKLLILTMLISLTSLELSAKIINDFFTVETWFYFEPGETYDIEGSFFYISNQNEQAYYPYVSDLIKAKEINKSGIEVKKNKALISWSPAMQTSQYGSQNSLGLKLTWDRMGSHYVDIIPRGEIANVKEVATKSIQEISMWVWSGNYKHDLVTVFQRKSGYQYIIPMAKLNFLGWKKLVAVIPPEIRTGSEDTYFSDDEFYFDRFRIYTDSRGKVGNIYVFFDNFEVLRRLDYKSFDGEDLIPVIKRNLGIGNQLLKNENALATDNPQTPGEAAPAVKPAAEDN